MVWVALVPRIDERPILVQVEIIALEEIVGDIEIGPSVSVKICGGHAQSESDLTAVDP